MLVKKTVMYASYTPAIIVLIENLNSQLKFCFWKGQNHNSTDGKGIRILVDSDMDKKKKISMRI